MENHLNLTRGTLYRVKTENHVNQQVEEIRLYLGQYKSTGIELEKFVVVSKGFDSVSSVGGELYVNGIHENRLPTIKDSKLNFEVLSEEDPDDFLCW